MTMAERIYQTGCKCPERCSYHPHNIDVRKTPIGHLIRCACGWSQVIPKQNALARAAKVRAACRKHLKEAK